MYFQRLRSVVYSITGESIRKFHFRIQNLDGQIFPLRYVLTNRKLADPHQGCVSDIIQYKERWIKRVSFGTSPAMHALRAQIDFRNTYTYEPSDSDIQAHLRHRFTDQVTYREVSAAFRSGKEVRQTFVLRREKLQSVSRNWSWRAYNAWSMIPTSRRLSKGQWKSIMIE